MHYDRLRPFKARCKVASISHRLMRKLHGWLDGLDASRTNVLSLRLVRPRREFKPAEAETSLPRANSSRLPLHRILRGCRGRCALVNTGQPTFLFACSLAACLAAMASFVRRFLRTDSGIIGLVSAAIWAPAMIAHGPSDCAKRECAADDQLIEQGQITLALSHPCNQNAHSKNGTPFLPGSTRHAAQLHTL